MFSPENPFKETIKLAKTTNFVFLGDTFGKTKKKHPPPPFPLLFPFRQGTKKI
jgi:hypothetical protein